MRLDWDALTHALATGDLQYTYVTVHGVSGEAKKTRVEQTDHGIGVYFEVDRRPFVVELLKSDLEALDVGRLAPFSSSNEEAIADQILMEFEEDLPRAAIPADRPLLWKME